VTIIRRGGKAVKIDKLTEINCAQLAMLEKELRLIFDSGGNGGRSKPDNAAYLVWARAARAEAFGTLLGLAIDRPGPQISANRSACMASSAIRTPLSMVISSTPTPHIRRQPLVRVVEIAYSINSNWQNRKMRLFIDAPSHGASAEVLIALDAPGSVNWRE
jgi:hypothetical protein